MNPEQRYHPGEEPMAEKPDTVEYTASYLAELKQAAETLADRKVLQIKLASGMTLIREEDAEKPDFAARRAVDFPVIDGQSYVLFEGSNAEYKSARTTEET